MIIGAAVRAARGALNPNQPAPQQNLPLNRFDPPPDAPPYDAPYASTGGGLYPPDDDRRRYSDATLTDFNDRVPLVKTADGYAPVSGLDAPRTPSPTPSEAAALSKIGKKPNLRDINVRALFQRKFLVYWIVGIVLLVVAILFVVFQYKIVAALQPAVRWMHGLKFGWLIPIGIMIVLSFPPLFGHEIVAMLVGVVWGLGEGFGIVAAGTFLGELANFYAFKWCCKARGEKLARTNLRYASLQRAITDGGFLVVLVARYSAIPGHFLTAIFTTCGMPLWVFCASAILGLPKQLILVYMGVALEASQNGTDTRTEKIVKIVVLIVTVVATILAMRFMRQKQDAALEVVVYERRKARQASGAYPAYHGGDASSYSEASTITPYDDPYKPPIASPRPVQPHDVHPTMPDPYDDA